MSVCFGVQKYTYNIPELKSAYLKFLNDLVNLVKSGLMEYQKKKSLFMTSPFYG